MKSASKHKKSRHVKNSERTTATKGCILEVGDDEVIRELIAAICNNRGFDVVQARCGDEALNLYQKRGPFVLVLSDLYYYDRVPEPPVSHTKVIRHGIQLALAIRKLAPEQKIVIHTAASTMREQMPEELGDISILKKPFRRKQLDALLP
jgi:CheY-like chemotaxis protein